jgi:hypothetical protein
MADFDGDVNCNLSADFIWIMQISQINITDLARIRGFHGWENP